MEIKVFIVDDHKMVIEGLQMLLQKQEGIAIVGYALSGEEALKNIPDLNPDVVLMDVNMPDMNGFEACKNIIEICPDIKVIAISMHKELSLIKLMLGNGAKGYVLKNAGQDEVLDAIKTVYSGKTYLDDEVNEIIINSMTKHSKQKTTSPFPKLSRREKDVLKLIINEYTTQEIADKLFISFGTVETHRRNMLIKTGARNTVGLVKFALEYNLLD
ncbi:MAG: response regulator transcription factor [Weeksellaceae bacterium]|jgi:DNA-binding NarL/FixJ family response regulator|nr:response regulator transcription factor [Weeksellaceae bacterium]